MRFGIPLSLQVMVYPLANLQISSAINSYGVACVAGNSAATTIHDLTASARSSFGTAAATFMGQNIGAKKHDRVRRSMFHCLWMCAAFCLPFAFFEWLFGPVLLKIFLGTDAVAIEFAMTRITILNAFTLFLICNSIMSPAIQAFGYPIFGTVNAVTWVLGFRIFWMACVYPTYTSYSSLIVCFVTSWVLTFITNLIILSIIYHRYKRKVLKQP
jgi:Na+-driven multidrug efflux pump